MRQALAAIAVLLAALPAAAQERPQWLQWQFGDRLQVRVPIGVQLDWRTSPETPPDLALRRLRVAGKGTLLQRIDFEVERELSEEGQDDEGDEPWRDVFVDVRVARALKVRGGRFKVPVSLDYQTSIMRGDFAERSLAADHLAPGRDVGVMAHGTVADGIKYYASVFGPHHDRAATTAGRVTVRVRPVVLGASFALTPDAEAALALPGPGDRTLPELAIFGNGLRRHAGADVEWTGGPFSARAELLRLTHERLHQGVDDEDLPDLVTDGWYLSGAWRATRQVQLAARVEQLIVNSGAGEAPVMSTPRAAVIDEGRRRITLGGDWSPTRIVMVRVNAVGQRGERDAAPLRWEYVLRLQVGL